MKIENDEDHAIALWIVHELFGAKKGTKEGDYLEKIVTAVEKYEREHRPLVAHSQRVRKH